MWLVYRILVNEIVVKIVKIHIRWVLVKVVHEVSVVVEKSVFTLHLGVEDLLVILLVVRVSNLPLLVPELVFKTPIVRVTEHVLLPFLSLKKLLVQRLAYCWQRLRYFVTSIRFNIILESGGHILFFLTS